MSVTNRSVLQFYADSKDNDSAVEVNVTVAYSGDQANLGERLQWLVSQPHQMVALVLSFLAITLNILSIAAVVKSRNKLTAHFRFILSLAVSDILIGTTVAAHILNKVTNPRWHKVGEGEWSDRLISHCAFMVIKALNTTSLNISLLNLMGMAMDHFLAILRPLHYPQLMNSRRAVMTILAFWSIAILCGFSDLLPVHPSYFNLGQLNYCEAAWASPYQDEYTMFAIAPICLFVMTFAYLRIFIAVKRRQPIVSSSQQEVAQTRKALLTTLLILGTFFLCWLPQCLFQVTLIIQVQVNPSAVKQIVIILYKADQYLYDLLLLNAILDPIIYAIRMREVQFGYIRLLWPCLGKYYKAKERRASTDVTALYSTMSGDRRVSRMSLNSMRVLDTTRRISTYKAQALRTNSGGICDV